MLEEKRKALCMFCLVMMGKVTLMVSCAYDTKKQFDFGELYVRERRPIRHLLISCNVLLGFLILRYCDTYWLVTSAPWYNINLKIYT